MQRIINDPLLAVEEMLEGFVKTHRNRVHVSSLNPRVIVSNFHTTKKVGIVTGGGSGHKPAFVGYCGKNMVDVVAVGEIFSSPSAKVFYDAFREADKGMGVACLYGNYAGDNMNVKMAIDMADDDDIIVKKVVANDDIASAPQSEREKRRGVAGEILMWKVAGAKAAQGADLDSVIAIAQKVINQTWSIGVGLSPCTLPANDKPNFQIENGMMEFGIGHHGEPGVRVTELKQASLIAEEIIEYICADSGIQNTDEIFVLVSGLGATPVMELYILYNEIDRVLTEKGITIVNSMVGNYFTSLDMQGATVSILKVDDEIKDALDFEVDTVGMKVMHHD
ncbi:dihydroxyacetone kinase subunit DhaK [Erysipelothrix sp. HDW6C]|uniref:dihydroxyacetone kinase subunit DhaK n=1 Tax=Erysipelothrix sp. HDW6C TaxID=2714930 RepID=UPI00140C3BBB|nr:dihydroxyacetone kinase subunit DhaK [Erysipelothrix sp. HDW6C]QIK70662.1 dihydroxyacetone kinase subunit DhaK [Erysipelothrix sp. HDW6C]